MSEDTLEPLDRGGCQKEGFFSGRARWVVDALQGCDVFDDTLTASVTESYQPWL